MNGTWYTLPAMALVAVPAAYAVEYMSIDASQRAAFPAGTVFVPVPVDLDAATRAKVSAIANPLGARDPRVWRATAEGKTLGMFYADVVIGKQDYIDYAVAIDAEGRVTRLDVLAYRESHGSEIRNQRWRAQFIGKTASDPVDVNQDISNISGATLSSRHVTDGVRRLLAFNALLAKQ